MMDPAEKKYEIESKLEKELNNLNILKERAQKSSQLTKNMVGILNSFEHRLARLEETILPVYNETCNLQQQQENMERTLAALDDVVGFYEVSQEVEGVIRAGPTRAVGLDVFLGAMNKLRAALGYFEKNNPQSVELENVSTLFNTGNDALHREFKEVLFKHSQTATPAMFEPDIPVDELCSNFHLDDSFCLTPFPPEVSTQLTRIAECLMANNRDEYMNVYARVRATVVSKTMQQYRDHLKSASGGSVHNVNTSPMPRAKFASRHDAAGQSTTRRLQHVFEKKANKMLLKASQTLNQSTGLTLGPRRSATESREEGVDETEMVHYLSYTMALQRLMLSERALMTGIVPIQHQHQIFQIIITDALDSLVADGESISGRARRCIGRHEFSPLLCIFPSLKILQASRGQIDRALEGCDNNLRNKYTTIINTMQATCLRILEEFIESVRSDSGSQLPKDGTVHELTSNTLVFLQQLLDIVENLQEVLGQDPTYSALVRDSGTDTLSGIYINKVLTQLNATLSSKSELYSDPALRAIFRLNNTNHALKAAQKGRLIQELALADPRCVENYQELITQHKRAYSASWSRVLSNIWSPDDGSVVVLAHQGKLRDRDRQILKERFSGFNKEMEELARLQRGYSIPDVQLRESLKRDNKEYVLPKYNAFYEKYGAVPFTKNAEKYVKYTPAQIGALIDQFFDVAA